MKDTKCRLESFFPAVLGMMLLLLPGQSMGGYILDPDFNNGGIKVDDIANGNDQANAVLLLEDGRIVVAGTSEVDPAVEVAVVRYNSNGTLDTTFASDGKATFTLGSGDDGANDLAITENGNIVVAGYLRETIGGEKKFALFRITPSGILDIDFGISGIVTLRQEEYDGEAFSVVIDSENRIVVGGVLRSEARNWAVAARFLEDGTLDTSFGDGGFRRIVTEEFNTTANFIAQNDDGSLILGGVKESDESPATAILFRLTENGDIDTAFGSNGEAVGDLGENSQFFSGVFLEDFSLVAAGFTTVDERQSITTAKFSADGKLDSSYGTNGIAVNDLGPGNAGIAHSITALDDGSLLVIGEGENGDNTDIVLVHLDATGSLMKSTVLKVSGENGDETEDPAEIDSSLSLMESELIAAREGSEPVLTDIDGGNDIGRGVVVTENGRVLVAGFTNDGADDDMALVAFTSDVPPPETPGVSDLSEMPYLIATMSPINVTRNGALSGGAIKENKEFDCESSDVEDCPLSVTARGVVFGVAPYPSVTTAEDTDDGSAIANGDGDAATSVFPAWVEEKSNNYGSVRRGQTSDGSGTGEFGSDITGITPDTFYFVRAYAVLSNDMIVYGPQKTFKTDDACFIATAAYGSLLESQVSVLRQFRDRYLKTNEAGRSFVRIYYHWSPELADFISQSSLLKFAARLVMLPLVAFSYFMVYFSLQMKIMLLLLLLAGVAYLTHPAGRKRNPGQIICLQKKTESNL
ncbi:delta-60 repeat domain-containing protein [Desulfopila inferna]|uniref:delta-60 repeat domain-containing protein n=1 Tax=Desulfopila inferna TaxID=468528 RepID=UPI001963C84C|nr:delta-60 repeat domain-containing protein [Desulfopila inferna]MBM9606300.1 hypothetical protein [Desulfopila inferna]